MPLSGIFAVRGGAITGTECLPQDSVSHMGDKHSSETAAKVAAAE